MAVHNGEAYLRPAIASILNQTQANFEFIIVDDGSTDGTAAIIEEYADRRFVLLNQSENQGLVRSLNHGLSIARGEYVARLDADDMALPTRFEKQLEFFQKFPETVLLGTDHYQVDENGKLMARGYKLADYVELCWYTLFNNPLNHSAVMFRRETIRQFGGYSTSPAALHIEDYELWSRLIWAGKRVASLPEPLLLWRSNPHGVSKTYPEIQSRNAAVLGHRNMRLLGLNELEDEHRYQVLSFLQMGSGNLVLPADVGTALADLENLVASFSDYFGLGPETRLRLRKSVRQRAAKSLLKSAIAHSYDLRLEESRALAEFAARLNPLLRSRYMYWRILGKAVVGARVANEIRSLRESKFSSG
jgi:glycosyltransferase involved in cell wall biosynthesis